MRLLDRRNLSIARLRQLCFGATTERARNVCGAKPGGAPKNHSLKSLHVERAVLHGGWE